MTPTPPSNRRSARRVPVNARFSLLYGHIDRYITNVSTTGAFVRAADLKPLGAEVPLRLTVTDHGIERIEGTGRVVRVSKAEPRGMGIEFVQLSNESRALIRRLVDTHDAEAPRRPMMPLRFEKVGLDE